MIKKAAFLFIASISCFPSHALYMDWSGFFRMEGYYTKTHPYYASYQFVLQPTVHVIDGLTLNSHFVLGPTTDKEHEKWLSNYNRPTGFVFLYGGNHQLFSIPYLQLHQMYMDYKAEFLKLRLGRATKHFGMGTWYFASKSPFRQWESVYEQFILQLEYMPFYAKPMVLHQKLEAKHIYLGLLQAGFIQEKWQIEALAQHDFQQKKTTAELFSQYQHDSWGIKTSLASHIPINQSLNLRLALETFYNIQIKIPIQLQIHAGTALGDMSFHPDYNIALLYGNRWTPQDHTTSSTAISESSLKTNGTPYFQIPIQSIKKALYISPRIQFSFFNDHLRLKPIFLVAKDMENKSWIYEMNIKGLYHWSKVLFLSLNSGGLYTNQKWDFALLTQVAVSF